MKCMKLSINTGWKPHIVCDLLDIEKYVLDKWIRTISKKKKLVNKFSTYEIIMVCTMLNFLIIEVLDHERLLSINWIKYKDDVKDLIDKDNTRKKIQIDWNLKEVIFTSSEDYVITEEGGKSRSFDLDEITEEVVNCLVWKNCA